MSIALSQINIYPVKSTKGISLSRSWVEYQGLSFDRRFMIALADGSMVTARKFPQLLHVQSALQADGIVLTYPNKTPLTLNYAAFEQASQDTHVWNDEFAALSTHEIANQWVSEVIGLPAQLLFMGNEPMRQGGKFGGQVSFADGFPLLVISEASLADLNSRTENADIVMDQFRTNLVVSNTEAYEEDTWQRICIGEVEFEVHSLCTRCILTTINPITTEPHPLKEPLATLAKYRRSDAGVIFGVNLIAKNEGMIQVDDVVEVLATQ